MSIVAKSLKKLKQNKKPDFNVSFSKKINFGFTGYTPAIYGLSILLFFVIIVVYGYSTRHYIKTRLKNTNFPAISELKSQLKTKEKIAANIKMQPKGLENLLILKRYDKMFELAKKENNLKYEGIYYFEKGYQDKAYNMLKSYVAKHKNDYEANVYLAFVLYRKNDYQKALAVLNSIKINNCELMFDRAVVSEANKEYYKALQLYKKSYGKCDNRAIKNRIMKKIIVLEYFLRNQDES